VLRKDVEHTGFWLRALDKRNQQSSESVISAGGPIVSITTFGVRLQLVYLALESIASGHVLPSRLILWLDDEYAPENLPESIHRLMRRGLEVRSIGTSYGPHGKYYPFVKAEQYFDTPLVTADDDVLYFPWWLEGLLEAYEHDSSVVNCYRAHVFTFSNGKPAPYHSWKRCQSTEPRYENFGTGVSGCIYPAKFLAHLKAAGPAFVELCPQQDDIWLHVNALRAGYKIKQITKHSYDFPVLPGTQEKSLAKANVWSDQNDVSIARTYNEAELKMMRDGHGLPL